MPLGCLAALFGVRDQPTPAPPARTVPDALPVAVKRYFFSRDENAVFRALEQTLTDTPYRVFPNVRLSDLFLITEKDRAAYSAARGRLKDRHVDFLIVDAAQDHRPVLAIELDGASHGRERQQHSDAVKDVIFRSAGLTLVRLPSRVYSAPDLRARLRTHLTLPD